MSNHTLILIKLRYYILVIDTNKGTQILKTDKLSIETSIRKYRTEENRIIYKAGEKKKSTVIGFINLKDHKSIIHSLIKTNHAINKNYTWCSNSDLLVLRTENENKYSLSIYSSRKL